MSTVYKLPLILSPQPEGGYTITCPLLPGLVTEVDRLEDVQSNVSDAVAALIEAYEALEKPLPKILQPVSTDLESPIWSETLISISTP